MSKVNGQLFRTKIGNYLVGATTDNEYTFEQDDPKTTTQDSAGFEESLDGGGITRASGSGNGYVDQDANYNAEELLDHIIGRAAMPTAQYGIIGGLAYTSKVKILNVKVNGTNQGVVSFSFSWVSSGAITKITLMGS